MGQLSGLDYSGKVVLVTGGTKGIGAGIACSFLQAGAQVIVCARTAPEVLPHAGSAQAVFMACDVRDGDSLKALFDGIRADFGRLDVVVNNAGGSPAAEAGSVSPRFHEGIIRLNLIAPLNVAQQANVLMQQQAEGGCIVFIGSISALRASPGTAAYGAAKAGVLALVQSLAVEWRPKCGWSRSARGWCLPNRHTCITATNRASPLSAPGSRPGAWRCPRTSATPACLSLRLWPVMPAAAICCCTVAASARRFSAPRIDDLQRRPPGRCP